jgi:hypothetical protein
VTVGESEKKGGNERIEMVLRSSRLALEVVVLLIIFLEATVVAVVFWPSTWLGQWPLRYPLAFPFVVVLVFMLLRLTGGRHNLRPDAAEAKVVLNDEFRRANFLRAQRVALMLVIIAQVPLGLLFMRVPATRAVFGMGASTMGLGISVTILLFLFFDREQRDE